MTTDLSPTPQHPWQDGERWKTPFAAIWTGQAFSLLGSQLVQFSLIWWLTQETGSATVLATATLVGQLPQILIGPIAGALVDRWNRRIVMIAADSGVALSTLWLVTLFAVGAADTPHVFLVLMLRSTGGAFHWPAMQASTSLMVPKQHLPRVAGFNQMLSGAINIVAPPFGALLLKALPIEQVLAIDIATAAIAIAPLLFIAVPQPDPEPDRAGSGRPGVLHDLAEGFRYAAHLPGLMTFFGVAIVVSFVFFPAIALIPILVTDHFGGEALQLAWMDSAWGIGIVLGGLTLGVWGGFKRLMDTAGFGLCGQGIGMAVVGMAPASGFAIGVGGLFFTGFMFPITNGPLQAILQSNVAPSMQGRIFTLMNSITSAVTPVSLLIAGPVADAVGVRFWFALAGITCLLCSTTALFFPPLRNLEADMQADTALREQIQAAQPT
jgi:DHA3 family macrolide efflux protein-like MFS transporter